jgi:hypothetical protein
MWSRRALAPRSSPIANRKSAIREHLFGPQIPSAPIYTDFQKGLRVQKICGNLRNLWMTRFSVFHGFDDGGGNCIAVEVEVFFDAGFERGAGGDVLVPARSRVAVANCNQGEHGVAKVVKHRIRRRPFLASPFHSLP